MTSTTYHRVVSLPTRTQLFLVTAMIGFALLGATRADAASLHSNSILETVTQA